MKDSNNTSLTIRTKVASSLNNSISSLTPLVRTTKFGNRNSTGAPTGTAAAASNPHGNNNNSDDEFELPLGNLIIDLDADIEKSNERFSGENSESHHFATAGTKPSAASGSSSASSSLANSIANSISNQSPAGSKPFEATNPKAMSASKTIRDVNNGTANSNSTQQINQSTSATQSNSLSNSSSSSGGKSSASSSANLQSVTADKSLRFKITRKSTGGKSSEGKLEVVQSDTNSGHNSLSSANYGKSASSSSSSTDKNGLNHLANSSAATNSATNEVEKIKHSSGKSKNSSHKEKKEKKDKADKNSSNNSSSAKNSNDAFGSSNSTPFNNSDGSKERNPLVLNFDKKALNQSSTAERHHHSFNQLKKDANDSVDSPPFKKSKNDNNKNTQPSSSLNHCTNANKPEMRSVSTATNASTMTEPECLGFCEPGSAICLEGITWVEAEGVLVVNVTWRGKSYVGTLLDCTRHDWGPPHPRLCDSPTSDLESKGLKSGRGKRARSSISEQDSRLFQSKLRNGKGRRNNFTVPASPLKVDQNNKRNNRNGKDTGADGKSTNSSQSNSRNTPTPTALDSSDSLASSPVTKQPSSPIFIECPEPTCGKKYRHINGLKYHQTHSHAGTKSDELDDVSKEPQDAESMEVESFASSPQCKTTTSDNNCNELNSAEPNPANSSESVDSKKFKHNCDKTKNSDNDAAHSPVYSDISDAGENGNDPTESSRTTAGHSSTAGETRKAKPDKAAGDLNNGEQRKESEPAKADDVKPVVKEEHKTNSDKEDKPTALITANNGTLDKHGLGVTNSNSAGGNSQPPPALLNPAAAAMNPNFQFPFNVLPHNLPHNLPLPFPMEEDPLDAYRMRGYGESYKKHMPPGFGKGYPKTDQLHLNELKQQHQQSQFKTPPLSSTSISPQSQQPPTSTHSSIFNQPPSAPNQQSPQNKPSSPYDFAHHEKQQREEMLKLSGRGSEERFSLSSNKNQLGNLSSPKQQPSSVQQLFGQQPNNAGGAQSNSSNHKDDQRTPKHAKQEEGIKPTMETTGPPPTPMNHSFFHSISPFLGPQVFPGALPFDPNPLFRAQQAAAAANPFNQQSFMNNMRYPNPLAPQLPPGLEMRPNLQPPPNLPGQELNNKLMNANGNKKAAFEMLQQVTQQYTMKDMQDKMLSSQSPNSAVKNGLPPVSLNNPAIRHSPSGQLASLANAMRKEDNLSPQRLHHPGMPPHPVLGDPYGALINNASGFPKR